MTAVNTGTNGQSAAIPQAGEERITEILEEDITSGYLPVMPLESMWGSGGDLPQITMRRDLEFMMMHPVVAIAMEYYRAGISGAEFWGGPDPVNPDNVEGKPISLDPRVSQFVLAHVERFWQRGVPIFQEAGYPHGWAPGQHIYRERGGMMTWDCMRGYHPNHGFVLTCDYQPVGERIINIRNSQPVDMWFASDAIPAKGAWYSHRPRFGSHYGRSQLVPAWRPWRRLAWKDGVEQVIDAAIYRAGYRGPIVEHPQEDMQTAQSGVPATVRDSAGNPRRAARDVARQIVEWAKAGAGFTIPSTTYPASQGGGKKWSVDFPDHVMDVRPLIEGARYLEDQIMLGVGVPPELIKAGGTGSGYSGRSIPREAFLDQQQGIANSILQGFVEQVIRPLVKWNFGDVPFEVSCKSLLQSQAGDKQGEQQQNGPVDLKKSQAAKDAWALRKQNDSDTTPPPGQGPAAQGGTAGTGPAMSLDPLSDRVAAVIRKFMERRVA